MSDLRRISAAEWQPRFLSLDPALGRGCRAHRALGDRAWARYLKPPSAYLPYGRRRLARLKFDPDPRALRLFGFAMEETERLYRAKREGMKVVALMGDYGAVAPLLHGFPGVTCFYPDFAYWSPFLAESDVLLERADRAGLGEDTCFVRAAVGGFASKACWPDPDLLVISTGASCDDVAAVSEIAAAEGFPTLYLDIPLRKDPAPCLHAARFVLDPDLPAGAPPREAGTAERLAGLYRDALRRAAEILGRPLSEGLLEASVERARRTRRTVGRIREVVATASAAPLPAFEAMLAEFAVTHGYGDPDEAEAVLEGVRDLVDERAAAGEGVLPADAVRLAWATPSPDPLLLTHVEDAGGRVAGTEYLIAGALAPPPPGDPVLGIARAFLAGSLLGSSAARARYLAAEVRRARAEGVVIGNLFGSSHCGAETPVLRRAVEEDCGVPVLAFDVPRPAPGGVPSQVRNRLEAFLEALAGRRRA